jgi:hypothetical protein
MWRSALGADLQRRKDKHMHHTCHIRMPTPTANTCTGLCCVQLEERVAQLSTRLAEVQKESQVGSSF